LRQLHILISSFFYSGYFPVASGTAGTIAFLPFYYFIFRNMNPWVYLAVTVVIYFVGVWSSSYASAIFGKKDPKKVVIDEVAGFLVTMMFIEYTPVRMVLGFFLSRIFDILKLPPARQAESLPSGNGIMLDDVIAGVQANIVLRIVIFAGADRYLEGVISRLF
jgi:phosphatidylglycerophosphatase A